MKRTFYGSFAEVGLYKCPSNFPFAGGMDSFSFKQRKSLHRRKVDYLCPISKASSLSRKSMQLIEQLKLQYYESLLSNPILLKSNYSCEDVAMTDSADHVDWASGLLSNTYSQNSFKNYTLLFFLGSESKEHIECIRRKFSEITYGSLVFVTANVKSQSLYSNDLPFIITDNQQCYQLSSELKILDPTGGGCYPLGYLVIIDEHLNVRYKIPFITINQNSYSRKSSTTGLLLEGGSTYAKFGLHIDQLEGFLGDFEESLMYKD